MKFRNLEPHDVPRGFMIGAIVCFAYFTARMFLGCGASATTEANTITAASYEAQLDVCVNNSRTRAEWDVCHCQVNAEFQRPCADAGADAGVEAGQ